MIIEQELDFTGAAYARRTDPSTSKAAAASVQGELATRLESVVLDTLKQFGDRGATTHELSDQSGIPFWSLSPRIKPLVRKNLVIDSGERRVGPSGRKSIVWKTS